MKNVSQHANCLIAYVQGHIEHPPIFLIKVELEEEHLINIIKVKKKYLINVITVNINVSIFEDYQPEEFLALLKNYRIAIDGTVRTTPLVTIH